MLSASGCVTLPESKSSDRQLDLGELSDRSVYIGDSRPLKSSTPQLLQAYREVLQHHHDPAIQREARKRVADLEVEGAMESSRGDYSGSIRRYLAILSEQDGHPDNEELLYNLARAYAQQGQLEEQYGVMAQLLANYPDSRYRLEMLFRSAEYLFTIGKNSDAIQHYQAILAIRGINPYYERSLYKKGWAELRLMNLQNSYDDFFAMIKRKLRPELLSNSEPLESLPLSDGDREIISDVLRGITLAAALSGEDLLLRVFEDDTLKPYAYILYAEIVERYISQERYNDAARVAERFVQTAPHHNYAPRLQMKVLESYRSGGFKRQYQRAQEEFVERYRINGEHWRFLAENRQSELRPHLKESNRALATNAHTVAQRSGRGEDYDRAIHWYRIYLDSFPDDVEAADLNYMLADLLFSIKRYEEAAPTYERSAYQYQRSEKSADAGFAALIAYQRHELKISDNEFREKWHWLAVSSALKFVNYFHDDLRTPKVLANAAQELYSMHRYQRSADTVRLLLTRSPLPEPEVLRTAWTILGYSEFELGRYAAAEKAYREVLILTRPGDALHAQRIEWLA
ncbi:MAG: tetratricopeptide repeat protein, partial [Chromatiales bacterium]|nr:tetratricopeptide repeat protein [Chromatiales bacterium]